MIEDSGSVFVISDGDLYAGLDTQDAVLPPQIDVSVSYTHLRAHETVLALVCRLL